MPTTRAARRAAAERRLLELPADVLGLVLYQLLLAHDIAAVAPTCHALSDAAKIALKLRPFSGEVVTLAGHTSLLRAVAAAPDGRIITGSWDSKIKIWRDGVCERTIRAHTDDVECVAMLPGGARFASGADDGTVKVCTLDGALEHEVEVGSIVWCIAALPDGVHFVVGLGINGDVRLYHIDGTLVHTFKAHSDSIEALAVSPDGQHIISSTGDVVMVWSVATKSLVSTCVGHTGIVLAVAAMPDGQRFLSSSRDMTVRVWLLDGTLQNIFRLHTIEVRALVALPDNQHALSASMGNTVKLFNVDDGAVLRSFRNLSEGLWCLALLPDGLRFVSGGSDHTACIVEIGLAPQPALK